MREDLRIIANLIKSDARVLDLGCGSGDLLEHLAKAKNILGYGIENLLNKTDLMLLVDCDVPWIPSRQTPNAECQFIHLGIDPEFAKLPLRGFPAHLILQTASSTGLQQLNRAISKTIDSNSGWQSQRVEREKMLLSSCFGTMSNNNKIICNFNSLFTSWMTNNIFFFNNYIF